MGRVLIGLAVLMSGSIVWAAKAVDTRPGAYLKKEKLWDDSVDLRSVGERQRDAELVAHYERLAELDAIANVADSQGQDALDERVDALRQREMERHHVAMMMFRKQWVAKRVTAAPAAQGESAPVAGKIYKRAIERVQKTLTPENLSERLGALEKAIDEGLRALAS